MQNIQKKHDKNEIGKTDVALVIPKRKFRFEEAGVLIAVLILVTLISFGSPYFLTADNLLRVGRQMAFIGILSG